ncbi:hypothetical protein HF086_002457 [Spodoptera exigua]|uniref:Glycoside hydrolase family 38 N-terminal domain-containing protein n=1 Tax=Spodoptera exigua TaxID=7107 RepID=A0A922SF04_SPOEX|nr:hypothetical protein HF086_002457 [Spodoptera exigua]
MAEDSRPILLWNFLLEVVGPSADGYSGEGSYLGQAGAPADGWRSLEKLNDTFGKCGWPHVGWQIDPFGHSREFANLLAMMGYDGLFLGRIDYQDKRARLKGKSSDIFTGVLFNTYSPPPGFCFDVLCADEPIIDDPSSPMYNVELKIMNFLDICTNMSKAYKTSNILLTMGEDFHYQDAAMWFRNLDKLIE